MRARIVENEKIKILTDAAEIKAALVAQTPIWVELESECEEANDLLTACLDIHPLTIEDIWATRTQPKLEDYRKYLYMIVHGVKPDVTSSANFVTKELDMFLGARSPPLRRFACKMDTTEVFLAIEASSNNHSHRV